MFAMSRADLAPAYTCGSYHRRGRKGCTAHHTRMDLLDALLKQYILRIKQNSACMLEALDKAAHAMPARCHVSRKALRGPSTKDEV